MGMEHRLGNSETVAAIDTAAYIAYRVYRKHVKWGWLREHVWQHAMCAGLTNDDKPSISMDALVEYARELCVREAKKIPPNIDNFRYTRGMVRRLLPDALSKDYNGASSQYETRTSTPAVASERGGYLAAVCDVRRALPYINHGTRHVLVLHYLGRVPWENLATMLNTSRNAISTECARAVADITEYLNTKWA